MQQLTQAIIQSTNRASTKRIAVWVRLWMVGIAILVLFTNTGFSQSVKDSLVVGQDDHSSIRVRYPDADHLRSLQTDHDYQYGTDAPPPDNAGARFFYWIYRAILDFLRSEAYHNVWQYVVLAAIAGLVIYLLTKVDAFRFLLPKKALSQGLDYENLAENIHEIDFNAAIETAIGQRNFRLAVRLLYLQTLKQLTDAGKIDYKPDKTNRQYVYELVNSPIQVDFNELTRQFEFVWYGDFPVDEPRFQLIEQQFRQFNTLTPSSLVNPIL